MPANGHIYPDSAREIKAEQSANIRIAALEVAVAALLRTVSDLLPGAKPENPECQMAQICLDVAKRHRVSVSDLRGHSRLRTLAQARQQAYRMCRDKGFSYPEIGRFFGNRDHTTVIYGIDADRRRNP